jgi:WD40 repeat protein/tetratricopeptide (TPR) repeat protein
VVVILGLGGTGKSQLVLGYLEEFRTDYSATFWIEADKRQTLERDFVQLYQHLYGVNAIAAQAVKPEDAVQAVKSWFQNQTRCCLLVFDGADALDKTETSYINLRQYIPNTNSVHVIITTRNARACEMTTLEPVRVDKMEATEAVELFLRQAGRDNPSAQAKSDANQIVQQLGYLALAIALAGSYVKETHIDLQEYLPKYRQCRGQILGEAVIDLAGEYNKTVFSTWEPSLLAISQRNPDAYCLLSLLSFLHFEDIFLDLFSLTGAESDDVRQGGNWMDTILPDRKINAVAMDTAFRILESFSLIQWNQEKGSFWMHKLVHEWGYDRLDKQHRALFSLAGLQLLNGWASKPTGPMQKSRLIPHITANFATVSNIYSLDEFTRETPLYLVDNVTNFLEEAGKFTEALTLRRFHARQITTIRGKELPDTLSSMHRLGNLYKELHMVQESKSILSEVLVQRRIALGEDDRATLETMNALSGTLSDDSKFTQAESLARDALKRARKRFGENDPITIHCMCSLSCTLFDRGNLNQARPIYKRALKISSKFLGEMDPVTIRLEKGFSSTLAELGDQQENRRLVQKASLMEQNVIRKLEEVYGDSHPRTLEALLNHACTLRQLGKDEECEALEKKTLEKIDERLGGDSLLALTARMNLTVTLLSRGKLSEAVKVGELAVQKGIKNFGEENRCTVLAMSHLAEAFRQLGERIREAIMLKRVLNLTKRVLGENNDETTRVKNRLDKALKNLNRKELAAFDSNELEVTTSCSKHEMQLKSRTVLSQHSIDTRRTANDNNEPEQTGTAEVADASSSEEGDPEGDDGPGDDVKFVCNRCSRRFGSQRALSQHMKDTGHTVEEPDEPEQQGTAEVADASSSEEDDSEDDDRPGDDAKFDCNRCSRQFGSQRALSQHVKDTVHSTWETKCRSLEGHHGSVTCVEFSEDGALLASGSDDETIRLWNPTTGDLRGILYGHAGGVDDTKFLPSRGLLVSCSQDKTIKLWDIVTGQEHRTLKQRSRIEDIGLSPDGKTVAAACRDGTVRLWDTASGQEIRTLKGHTGWVESVTFSPDGRLIASVSQDNVIRLWDWISGKKSGLLQGHDGTINRIEFSPNGRNLVSAADDQSIRLWDVTERGTSHILNGHEGGVADACFSSDGKLIASASDDGTAILWDFSTKKRLATFVGHGEPVWGITFSQDRECVASASDKTVRLWDTVKRRNLRTFQVYSGECSCLEFSPDSKVVGFASTDRIELADV